MSNPLKNEQLFHTFFDRFCPCCAMVSCGSCVSKRVFEVVSRQVVSVCLHCYRASSRIRHPPQALQDATGIDEALRGKWWTPEELGIIDYSQSLLMPESDGSKPIVPSGLALEDIDIYEGATDAATVTTANTKVDNLPGKI